MYLSYDNVTIYNQIIDIQPLKICFGLQLSDVLYLHIKHLDTETEKRWPQQKINAIHTLVLCIFI